MKKYYSMDEAVKATKISSHKIRYLEKTDPEFIVTKIRSRRYFTKENIEYISKKYSNSADSIKSSKIILEDSYKIIEDINSLIDKFKSLPVKSTEGL